MDVSIVLSQALSAAQPANEYVTGIVTNLLSEVIVRGGEEWLRRKDEAARIRLRDDLSEAISDALLICIRSEQDEEAREVLAMTFCDEVLLGEFVHRFKRNDVGEETFLEYLRQRAGEARWATSESLFRSALRSLIDRAFSVLRDDEDFFRSFLLRTQQENTRFIENAAPQIARISDLEETILRLEKKFDSLNDSSFRTTSPQPLTGVTATEEKIFPQESLAKHLQNSFDLARNELEQGSAKRAREQFSLLVQTLEEIGIPGNETLYFRCRSNLGIATFYCGDPVDAAEHLEAAFPYSQKSLKGLSNLALAQALRGDLDGSLKTLEEALQEDPAYFSARLQQVDILNRLDRAEEARTAAELLIPENDGDRIRKAQLLLTLRQHERALEIGKDVLTRNADNADALSVVADATAFPLLDRVNEGGLSGRFLTTAEKTLIKSAIELYERALPDLRRADRDDYLSRVLSNLSAFSAVAGFPDKAVSFIRDAIRLSGPSRDNICNLYHAALGAEDYDEAVEAAIELRQWDDHLKSLCLQVEALIAGGNYEDGLERISEAVHSNPSWSETRDIKNLRVRLLYDLPDVEQAVSLLNEMLEAHPEDSLAWLTAAEIAREQHDAEREEGCLLKAIQHSSKRGMALHCQHRLAHICAEQRRWKEALENFVLAGAELVDSPWRINALVCLFNLGRFEETLNFASRILAEEYDRKACEMAIECCLKGHLLDRAVEYAEILRKQDNSEEVLGYLAHLHARLGNLNKSKQLIRRGLDKDPRDFGLLHLKSGVHLLLKEYDASLETAFKALEVAAGDQVIAAHRLIVGNAFSIPNDVPPDPERVARVQESVAFLVAANDPSFQQIEIDDELKALRERLKEQQKAASEGVSLFSEKGMPAYCIARMSGKDIYEVWKSLTSGGTLFVRMAIGMHEEQAEERELARKYEGIVLDPIALFTFAALGQLPNLKRFYSRVVVPFPLYERLKRMSDELSVGNETTGVIQLAPDGEHIFLKEDVRTHYAEKRDFLGRIVEFLEGGTVERTGFFPPEDLNDVGEFLGTCNASAFAAVCIAKAENLGLVSDDVATRQLAKMALGVDSFCSQRVIEVAAEKGKITAREQYAFVIGLFEHNYAFVSDSPGMLGFFFQRNGWQIDSLARRIIERFDTGQMHHISASRIYGTIMAEGWLQSKDSSTWLKYFCERLRSSGDVQENFRWAAIGAMQALADAPEIFFSLTMRIRELGWIEREARESFVLAFRAAEMVFGKENAMMPSACPSRWRKVVQSMRKGDMIRRMLR